MGYRGMPIQALVVDVMAGGGGAAGQEQSIRHHASEPGNPAGNAMCAI